MAVHEIENPDGFMMLGEALAGVAPGDTVRLGPGEYTDYDPVLLRDVALEGWGPAGSVFVSARLQVAGDVALSNLRLWASDLGPTIEQLPTPTTLSLHAVDAEGDHGRGHPVVAMTAGGRLVAHGCRLMPGSTAATVLVDGGSRAELHDCGLGGVVAGAAAVDLVGCTVSGIRTTPESLVRVSTGTKEAGPAEDQPDHVLWPADGSSITTVLPRLRPGATLLLEEGDYDLTDLPDGSFRAEVDIRGLGSAGSTRLTGQVVLADRDRATVAHVTLVPADEHPALVAEAVQDLQLVDVGIGMTTSGEGSACFLRDCGTTAVHLAVAATTADRGYVLLRGGRLQAARSELGALHLCDGAAGQLDDCALYYLSAEGNSNARSGGRLRVRANDGSFRPLLLDLATMRLGTVDLEGDEVQVYVEEGTLAIADLVVDPGFVLRAYTARNAVVEPGGLTYWLHHEGADPVEVAGAREPRRAAPARSGGRAVMWRPGTSVRELVADLGPGDSLLLDEGDYDLDDLPGSILQVSFDVRGTGRPWRTRLRGQLWLMDLDRCVVSNVFLEAPDERSALHAERVSDLRLVNVKAMSPNPGKGSTMYLEDCATTMHDVLEFAAKGERAGVSVRGGGLQAHDSTVEWLLVDVDATARLADCTVMQVWASGRSVVTCSGKLTLEASGRPSYPVYVDERARLEIESLHCEDVDPDLFVNEATLRVRSLAAAEGKEAFVRTVGECTVDMADVPWTRQRAEDDPER